VPDLSFEVEEAFAARNAAMPQLSFKVRVKNAESDTVHSIALRVQAQIEPVRRRYTAEEQFHLKELFGEPELWSKSLHPLLWENANVTVPGFTGTTTVDVPVPCSFDFNVAITKYIYGLQNGDLPISLLFSGTIFHMGRTGLQIAQIPWDREASYCLPIRVWKEMMDIHYPNTAWLCLRRDVFERLNEYRARQGNTSWEQAFERMLSLAEEVKS
jgi:uncharacterized protein DUF6084